MRGLKKKDLPDDQALGRSKGGFTTKIHALCNTLEYPVAFHLTAGQDHDLAGADILIDKITQAKYLLADRAYDAHQRVRKKLEDKGCTAVIPSLSNRRNPSSYDKEVYKKRHLIENFFAKLKQYRAVATRYDKTSQNFLGALHMVAIVLWLN